MEMQIALAAEPVYPVDKLPKGAKVIGYEVYHQNTKKLLGRGEAFTVKQAIKRLEFHAASNMTVDLTVLAMDGEHKIKMTDAYTLKSTGPVKVV
jgi:hypothetical protein